MKPECEFNLLDSPLDGRNLIEASAGTGKTYTIARLFIRLLLEKALEIGQILVLTFTEAATEELKKRIRSLLHEARICFEDAESDDPFLDALVERFDAAQSLEIISAALRDFDRNAIFTIHGFCRRILVENAFESTQAFDVRFITDQSNLVHEISLDFWRKFVVEASPLFIAYLMEKKIGPEKFERELSPFISPQALSMPPVIQPQPEEVAGRETAFLQTMKAAAAVWSAGAPEIMAALRSMSLDGRKYGENCFTALQSDLDRLFRARVPSPTLFRNFEKLTTPYIRKSLKKDGGFTDREFFSVCESLHRQSAELNALFDQTLLYLRSGYLSYCSRELADRKERDNILYFDDLLTKVRTALEDERGDNQFTAVIRKAYRAALIDEFQDTDPVQYAIFSSLFLKGSILFIIGDPKQAIYGFRGADIFAYLKASKAVDRMYTLSANFRSSRQLIGAVNAIFSNIPAAFLYAGITYRPVVASSREVSERELNASFTFWLLDRKSLGVSPVGSIPKAAAKKAVAEAMAQEIIALTDRDDAHHFKPSDIAVLVRTNSEADLVYNTLASRGIPVILENCGNIFETTEAIDFLRLLNGIAAAMKPEFVRAALCTCFFDKDAADISEASMQQPQWDSVNAMMNDYLDLWNNQGFMRMIQTLFSRENTRARLLSRPRGERILTNILHLTEMIHQQELHSDFLPVELCNWLLGKLLQASHAAPDEELLRLESDETAVRVMTIHKSKGLEFPVVFCPFCWEGAEQSSRRKNQSFLFHDPQDDHLQKLALSEEERERYRDYLEIESLAEAIRLLYVALTRAKYRCYCAWGMAGGAETSALAYLFHGHDVPMHSIDELSAKMKGLDDAALRESMESCMARSNGAIVINELPANTRLKYGPIEKSEKELAKKTLSATIPHAWQLSSFTKLLAFESRFSHASDFMDITTALPPARSDAETFAAAPSGIADFPRGSKSGVFFHELLQQIDFTKTGAINPEALIRIKLDKYGFESSWTEQVAAMIDTIVTIPLVHTGGVVALKTIPEHETIREMEFYFPLKRISPAQGNEIMKVMEAGFSISKEKKYNRLEFSPRHGFMKGFVDLVFRHDGRFFLIDWKSNFLGPSFEDYASQALDGIMMQEHYNLQYYLYITALHAYLKRRDPHYEYHKHFGGAFYLFIRGMSVEKGPEYGIFYKRPDENIIADLHEILIG